MPILEGVKQRATGMGRREPPSWTLYAQRSGPSVC